MEFASFECGFHIPSLSLHHHWLTVEKFGPSVSISGVRIVSFMLFLKYFPFVTCKILVGLTVESTEVGAAASSFLSFERQCVFSNSMIRKDEFLNCLKVWSLTTLLIVYLDFCTVYLD